MGEVRWFSKSFLKYRAEKYNENKRYIPLSHADGRSTGTGTKWMLGCSMGLEIERSFYCINLYTLFINYIYLEISGANCKCGIVYSAYRGFILYCNWNRLTAGTVGTFCCKCKMYRKRVRKGNLNWWNERNRSVAKIIWNAVKWSEVKWSDMRWSVAERHLNVLSQMRG